MHLLTPFLLIGGAISMRGRWEHAPLSLLAAVAEPAASIAAGDRDEPPLDRIELRNGTKYQGRIVYQDDAQIILREGARERPLPMKDVKSVVSRVTSLREVVQRWLELDPQEMQRVRDLAQYCKRVELNDEAQVLQRFVLCEAPNDEDAHLAVGHVLRGDQWSERVGGKWMDWTKASSMRTSWKTPWELRTSHYRLRTNLKMSDAVRAAIDLECFYYAFHHVFGPEMLLRETLGPLEANVHADAESFPVAYVGRVAYFDPQINRLVVDASKGIDRGLLFHEAVHELLHNTANQATGKSGDLPAWLDEGLAEYMSWSMIGAAGRATFDPHAISRVHFDRHAAATEPFSLSRLLVAGTEDFLTSKSELRYSEAYTLVHFCLHGQGEKYRRRFFDFVRGAYKGQGSPTHFKDALQVPDDVFEKAWMEHVARRGEG